ncbi:MAG: hypothetical protein WBF08_09595 [Candidatus Bathyarchaeia archaeon]
MPVMLVAFITSGLIFPALAPNGVVKITVEPPVTNVAVSTEFTVDIWIRDLHVDMTVFSFIVNWDSALMEYVSHKTYVQGNGWTLASEAVGADTYGIDAYGPAFGADARWITITFHCLGEGFSLVDIGPSDMTGSAGPIAHNRGSATLNQIEPAPVGGVASPINKLEILTPYITLAGLIIAVSTVYVIKRRKD